MESRYMGWGFRVDREGNLHDAFPAPADREAGRWPRTPWRVKVRHPRKHRAKRLLKGTFNAAVRLMRACRPARAARVACAPGLGRA